MDAEAPPAAAEDQLPPLPVPHPVHDYEKIRRVGEGTYGIVYQARHRSTREIVALKKLRMDRERDGMPVTSVREVRTRAAALPAPSRCIRAWTQVAQVSMNAGELSTAPRRCACCRAGGTTIWCSSSVW